MPMDGHLRKNTRYPEVIPLKKFTATAVAEKLIELFSRHSVLKEILTDQLHLSITTTSVSNDNTYQDHTIPIDRWIG